MRWPFVAAAVLAIALGVSRAPAILVSTFDGATIQIGPSEIPPEVTSGSYSILAWAYRQSSDDSTRAIVQVPGLLELVVDGRAGASFTVRQAWGIIGPGGGGSIGPGREVRPVISARVSGEIPVGEWVLLCASYDRSLGQADLWVVGESFPTQHGTAREPGWADRDFSSPVSNLAVGAIGGGHPAFRGALGTVAIRNHALTDFDIAQLWDMKRYLAFWDHQNDFLGGKFNGLYGCRWMVGGAMSTLPNDAGVGGTTQLRSAQPGDPLTSYNTHLYTPGFIPTALPHQRLRAVQPVHLTEGFAYASHRDAPYSGFFITEVPGTTVSLTPEAALAAKARQLATDPDGLLRVVISSNSRAVIRFDGSGNSPGNYQHGFMDVLRSRVAGVMLRPPEVTGLETQPWFGFNVKGAAPRRVPTTDVVSLDDDTGPMGDFTRFSTCSVSDSRGPGSVVRIKPGALYTMRCGPEAGSLVTSAQPLVVDAWVLAFPGSSALIWRWDRAWGQGVPGIVGVGANVQLDTTTWSRTMAGADRAIDPSTLELAGDWTANVRSGLACHIAMGPGAGAISLVHDVVFAGGVTRVRFAQPLGGAPAAGSELLFGPWDIRVITHEFAGVPANDPRTWRGIELKAVADAKAGVMVLSHAAHRPGVDGYIIGGSGWGGHGYDEQIDASFPEAIRRWMVRADADAWIQVPAQQRSDPSVMERWADLVREALPEADLVWAGEMAHGGNTGEPWHAYIMANAWRRNIVGISALEHPAIGSFDEQLADGLRSDGAHLSGRGVRAIARVWIDQLAEGAQSPCMIVDFDRDGVPSIIDFVDFGNALVNQERRADLNRDGMWDIFDMLVFQTLFAECTG